MGDNTTTTSTTVLMAVLPKELGLAGFLLSFSSTCFRKESLWTSVTGFYRPDAPPISQPALMDDNATATLSTAPWPEERETTQMSSYYMAEDSPR